MNIPIRIKCCDRQMNQIRAPNISKDLNKRSQSYLYKKDSSKKPSLLFKDVLASTIKERNNFYENFR